MNEPDSPDSAAKHAAPANSPSPQAAPSPRRTSGRGRWKLAAALAVFVLAAWLSRNWFAEMPTSWARQALADHHDDDAAAQYLEYAGWIAPRHPEAEFLRVRLSRRNGDFPAALEHLTQAESWGWPAVQIELERWLVEAESGRTRQAAASLGQITANPHADPAAIFGAFVRGCLKSRRSFPHAFGLLGAWSGNYPLDPEPHVLMARMSAEVRDWARAEQALVRAVELSPDDPAANMVFGELLVSRQRYSEARERFQHAAADSRLTSAAVVRQAECLRRLGRHEEARQLLEWVERHQPGNRAARVERALLALAERRPADAIPHLQQVLAVHPDHPDANLALGQALQATGETEAARRHFQLASHAQAQWNRVSDLTWKVIEQPDVVDIRHEIAAIHLQYGSEVAALEWFDSVFDLAPNHEPSVRLLVEHFRIRPTGRDPDAPLVRHFARRFAAAPAASSTSADANPTALPKLTTSELDAGQQRWQSAGPTSYEIEVQVAGRQAATYRTTVRDGQVSQALRNGLPLTQSRTAGAWSVPGMFTTIRLDLERMTSLETNTGDSKSGVEISGGAKSGDANSAVGKPAVGKPVADVEGRSPQVSPTAAFQVELSGQFHPQWGYPERLRRVERGAGSTNPEVSWTVVRFEVLDRAGDSR